MWAGPSQLFLWQQLLTSVSWDSGLSGFQGQQQLWAIAHSAGKALQEGEKASSFRVLSTNETWLLQRKTVGVSFVPLV